MAEVNILLDALLDRAGLSHAGLARQLTRLDRTLRYDHASVARWIRDHAIPRNPVPLLICRIIGERLNITVTPADIGMTRTPTDENALAVAHLVERAAAVWRGDQKGQHPRAVLTGAQAVAPLWEWEHPPDDDNLTQPGRRRVDPTDVARLRHARVRYQEMYRRVGGVPVRTRIMATLTSHATPLLRDAYDNRQGRDLFQAVAGLAALAGVCAYDANHQPLSQRHLLTALRLAKASGDRPLGAYVVAIMATQALHLDEYRLVVQYAQAALRAAGPVISPALAADLHSLAGKAYARIGDTAGSHQHLRQAEALATRLDPGTGPAEVSYVQPGLVETQIAEALRRLGDLTAAHTYATESVRTAGATHLRGQVHRHAGLALILTAQGDLDRASHTGHQMLDRLTGMESGRLTDRIRQVATALKPYATQPAVAAFLQRAHHHTDPTGP
ncbi:hypothetical protein [Micromonospora sp. WMMD1082]|uniref:hypothetical protein n=1 Tax=Micromonospora sp. WMMD1082 TaxID=3016104 RepID=UPI002415FCC5|nr:hypothetical protein [Micromonospora sp. WMMD1082]MDG4795106.1 hypothetical protein [Micromonospora sp. WMMD1082]